LLDGIESKLLAGTPWSPPSSGFFANLFSNKKHTVKPVTGLYLWGGVGRGKTHLCDLFFNNVAIEDKTRLHFHRFMQQIHDDLNKLGEVENPLKLIADDWAQRARLLLLDEIHVHDITDAMLLGTLLSELFDRGVTLVTTSNVPPDGLYKDGLQRSRFLPAIDAIVQATNVYEMVGDMDYRLRLLQTEAIYIVDKDNAHNKMQAHFDRLKVGGLEPSGSIMINQRAVPVIALAGDVVWFEFDELCRSSRSTKDYIELASEFHTVLISNIPVLGNMDDDAARRLVNLIDEFYDRSVKLVMSAEALPDALYKGKRLNFEFVRAASRLTEMQTKGYLSASRQTLIPS